MAEPVRDIANEIKAAELLRAQLADLASGDPEFMRDAIEGETSLHETIRALVSSISEDEALADGLKAYLDKLGARLDRYKKRIEFKRQLVASGLDVAGLPKIETDIGTVSLSPTPPRAIVTDEAALPSEFFRSPPPAVDKRALAAALKEGRAIPGASLSNGGQTVRINR